MDVLDTLRALRQTHSRLRMVFTGSIGLHHVTTALRDAGHANDATNDMAMREVPPLSIENGIMLSTALLEGEKIRCDDRDATASEMSRQVDVIPFYLHNLAVALLGRDEPATPDLVRQIVEETLVDHRDPWHLGHYRERADIYYGEDLLPVALAILDFLAASGEPQDPDRLLGHLGTVLDPSISSSAGLVLSGDRELLLKLLKLLCRDHYLVRHGTEGGYCFRFDLIRRWWCRERSLT